MARRDTSRDGFANKLETKALTGIAPFWRVAQRVPIVRTKLNRLLINRAVAKSAVRPHPLSTFSDYSCWEGLTDRTFAGRHLPPAPADFTASLPPVEEVVELFRRPTGGERLSDKSTLLFTHFVQWFTDGFLRTDRSDVRKNTTNHEIDICPLYGLRPSQTRSLRSGEGGRLKSQTINGEEYPLYYFVEHGVVHPEFADLPILFLPDLPQERVIRLFALGVERANNSIGFVMLNTLFLREHNRIAGEMAAHHQGWDDERLFQTARNTLIALLMKIVIEEYINHITPYPFKFRVEPASFWDAPWYRTNWVAAEFNLLYRWHSMVPDTVKCGETWMPVEETLFNNPLLTDRGLAAWFHDASSQPCGDLGLFNTHPVLLQTEAAGIAMGRALHLRTYNDYREAFKFPRVTSFEQISSRQDVRDGLRTLYGSPDRVEMFVGAFAEDVRERSALSPFIGRMVGVDAFSQALTNPLLSIHVFNEQTFSPVGWRTIRETNRLGEIVQRNVPAGAASPLVSFTQPGKLVA